MLSQAEAAHRCEVSTVAFQRWEYEKTRPHPYHRRKLHEVFGDAFRALGISLEMIAATDQKQDDPQSSVATDLDTSIEDDLSCAAIAISDPAPPSVSVPLEEKVSALSILEVDTSLLFIEAI
jgi:hypothetical protein